jgi:hypothetical protein
MVKSVLKMMEQLKELLEHEKAGPGCTPEWLQNTYSPIKHYVRCELELSRSGGSEGERATWIRLHSLIQLKVAITPL